MAVESSQIPEKTVEQIFDERYPLDKWRAQVVPTAEAKRTVRTHGSAICDQSWHADSNGFQQYAG